MSASQKLEEITEMKPADMNDLCYDCDFFGSWLAVHIQINSN